jgi:hypothetical protein
MSRFEGIRFCDNCPYVPDGVVAEVQDISYTDMAEYRNLVVTKELPDFVEDYVDTSITVTSVAVTSTNRNVDVGDEAVLRVERNGQNESQVAENLRLCNGPKRNFVAKALGQRGVCQAVQSK